jgi:hypothetical protein
VVGTMVGTGAAPGADVVGCGPEAMMTTVGAAEGGGALAGAGGEAATEAGGAAVVAAGAGVGGVAVPPGLALVAEACDRARASAAVSPAPIAIVVSSWGRAASRPRTAMRPPARSPSAR